MTPDPDLLQQYTSRLRELRREGPVTRGALAEEMRLDLVSYDAAKPVPDKLFTTHNTLEKMT